MALALADSPICIATASNCGFHHINTARYHSILLEHIQCRWTERIPRWKLYKGDTPDDVPSRQQGDNHDDVDAPEGHLEIEGAWQQEINAEPYLSADEETCLLACAQAGDDTAFQLLCHCFARLVLKIAKETHGQRPMILYERFSAGMLGLMSAIERYDLASGRRFASFAAPTIRGYIRNEGRSEPKSDAGSDLSFDLDLGGDDDDKPIDLYDIVGGSPERSDQGRTDLDKLLIDLECSRLRSIVNLLLPDQMLVITQLFGLNATGKRYKQKEIAEQLGISPGRVSQIKQCALQALQQMLSPEHFPLLWGTTRRPDPGYQGNYAGDHPYCPHAYDPDPRHIHWEPGDGPCRSDPTRRVMTDLERCPRLLVLGKSNSVIDDDWLAPKQRTTRKKSRDIGGIRFTPETCMLVGEGVGAPWLNGLTPHRAEPSDGHMWLDRISRLLELLSIDGAYLLWYGRCAGPSSKAKRCKRRVYSAAQPCIYFSTPKYNPNYFYCPASAPMPSAVRYCNNRQIRVCLMAFAYSQ
jgi:RNA polymerase sigma factor (sigma-70 family)